MGIAPPPPPFLDYRPELEQWTHEQHMEPGGTGMTKEG
jgi:hypothetical protein